MRREKARRSSRRLPPQAQMAPLIGMSLSGYRKREYGTRNVSGLA